MQEDKTPARPVVEVRDLHVRFSSRERDVTVVHGISFDLQAGETLCLLGESGSGKSVSMRALMRLLPQTTVYGGRVRVDSHDVLAMKETELSRLRGRAVSMIFQEPMTSLDPVFTIGQQITEIVRRHEGASRHDARRRALELLNLVQVPSAERRLDAYPHELSGGLRQRAMIAIALACRPRLLLADEPTTALDASVQIQVLLLLRRLQQELGMATVFVTHDIGVASEVADRVAVMYAGRFVEEGTAVQVLRHPAHPYTQGLLASTVKSTDRHWTPRPIPGYPPDLRALPAGCSFRPRCAKAIDACAGAMPPLLQRADGRGVRCIVAGP